MATSYANTNGSGARSSVILSVAQNMGALTNVPTMLDGSQADALFWGASGSLILEFWFPTKAVIDEAKWYQDNSASHGTFKWQGSLDRITWDDIGSPFTLGGSATQTQTELNGNTTAYRHYRLYQTSGTTSGSPYLREVEFKIEETGTTTYGHAHGRGDRTGSITVTSSGAGLTAADNKLVNGVCGASDLSWTNADVTGDWVQFDFGSGRIIQEARWFQSGAQTHGIWQWQGSNNASSWANVGSDFTLGASSTATSWNSSATYVSVMGSLASNTNAYRYWRIIGISGAASGSPFLEEVEFDIATGAAYNGGGVAEGTNPPASYVPTDFPLNFVQINIDGTAYYFGETQLNDPASWAQAPGKKPAKLVGLSVTGRRLSKRGSFSGVRCTVTLADTDRQFRALAATTPITGAFVACYVVSDAVRRALGEPFRYFAGEVVSHRAAGGFLYELECEDILSRRLNDYNTVENLPPDVFTEEVFPGLDDAIDGRSIPICCGSVSDENAAEPQGVAPIHFVGQVNFSTYFGGDNIDAYAWVITQCARASGGLQNGYYNEPTTPYVRVVIPGGAWGTVAWAPGMPNWSDTGLAEDFAVYPNVGESRTYIPFFVATSEPHAQAILDGKVLVAFNLGGPDDSGEGTGAALDSAPRLWQWILTNFVFSRYKTGAYFDIPDIDPNVAYSIIDTDTVEQAHLDLSDRVSGGYIVGFIMGADGSPTAVFHQMQDLCEGADLDWGINRHGQLIVSVETTTADAVLTFTTKDIAEGGYESWIAGDELINRIEHQFGYRYVPQFAPAATPAEGEPVPSQPLPPSQPWTSKLRVTEDTASQTDTKRIATYKLENRVVREEAVGTNLETTLLARYLGPAGDGPRMFHLTGGWNVLGNATTTIDLGSVIAVQHPERLGTSASGTDICRVLAITVDPLRDRVTLEGRVLRTE